jgi:hypothetical protein
MKKRRRRDTDPRTLWAAKIKVQEKHYKTMRDLSLLLALILVMTMIFLSLALLKTAVCVLEEDLPWGECWGMSAGDYLERAGSSLSTKSR